MAMVAVLALSAGFIHASGTDAQKCQASKVKAVSKKLSAKLKCIAKAASKGAPVDGTCLSNADTKFNSAVGKADAKGGCALTGDGATLAQLVDNDVNTVSAMTTSAPLTCCSVPGNYCYYAAGDPNCLDDGNTLGAAGTVCDSVTGACIPPPAGRGRTCSSDSPHTLPFSSPERCFAGPGMTLANCAMFVSVGFPDPNEVLVDQNAICPPNGGRAVD